MGLCNRGERLDSILNIGWGSVDRKLLRGKGGFSLSQLDRILANGRPAW